MKLIDLKVMEYLDVLRSDAPAPGGGSVSALAGAQAAGLVMMVAGLTLGREKYASSQAICRDVREKSASLYEELLAAVDQDTEAFLLVAAAYKLPKGTEEEKAARSDAIAAANLEATKVPYRVMELAYEGLLAAQSLVGNSNPNAASDLGVAVLNFMTSIKGAWLNVKINLPGVREEELARSFKAGGEKIYREADSLSEALYKEIAENL